MRPTHSQRVSNDSGSTSIVHVCQGKECPWDGGWGRGGWTDVQEHQELQQQPADEVVDEVDGQAVHDVQQQGRRRDDETVVPEDVRVHRGPLDPLSTRSVPESPGFRVDGRTRLGRAGDTGLPHPAKVGDRR